MTHAEFTALDVCHGGPEPSSLLMVTLSLHDRPAEDLRVVLALLRDGFLSTVIWVRGAWESRAISPERIWSRRLQLERPGEPRGPSLGYRLTPKGARAWVEAARPDWSRINLVNLGRRDDYVLETADPAVTEQVFAASEGPVVELRRTISRPWRVLGVTLPQRIRSVFTATAAHGIPWYDHRPSSLDPRRPLARPFPHRASAEPERWERFEWDLDPERLLGFAEMEAAPWRAEILPLDCLAPEWAPAHVGRTWLFDRPVEEQRAYGIQVVRDETGLGLACI